MLNMNIKTNKATYNIKCPKIPILSFFRPPQTLKTQTNGFRDQLPGGGVGN